MTAMAWGILIGLTLLMTLSMVRVIWGPTAFDRLAGLGLIGTKTIIVLILVGYITDQVYLFVDIALAYSSIAYIGTLALAKFYEQNKELG